MGNGPRRSGASLDGCGTRGRWSLGSSRRLWWVRGRGSRAAGKGRANVAILDVRVRDVGVGSARLDVRGSARRRGARATGNAGLGRVGAGGVVGVEPEHVDGVIVPDGEHENHAGLERVAHGRETALGSKGVCVAKFGFLRCAEGVGNGVAGGDVRHVDVGVGNHFAVLHVLAPDFLEVAGGSARVGDELGNDSKDLTGIDGLADTIKGLVAHAIRVEITTSLIARGGAGRAGASSIASWGAGMGSVGCRHLVGFPNIHLRAARTEVAFARVGTVGIGSPPSNIGLGEVS